MKKIKNPWLSKKDYHCFGCCPNNPLGLKMEFYEEGDEIISYWHPNEHYQGWVGVMHGGILSTIIDEIAGWVVLRKMQTTGVTSKLEVNYRKPILSSSKVIIVRSHISSILRNIVKIEASIENENHEVCVNGVATYFTFDKKRATEMGFTECEIEDE
jgi:hypothetical protein